MLTLADAILRRTRPGDVLVPKDFAALGPRTAVDKALSRLAADPAGRVRRIGRGVYDRPRVSRRLGIVAPPDPDAVAAAIGRRTGSRVLPSGAAAANRLGFSTQVPARPAYLTDGPSRTVRLDDLAIDFRHAPPWLTRSAGPDGDVVTLALAALRHLGRGGVDDGVVRALARLLTPRDRRRLAAAAAAGPSWLSDVAVRVADGCLDAEGAADGRVRQAAGV